MTLSPLMKRWGWAGWVLLLATAILDAATVETKRVLVVNSFGSGSPPFTTHSVAFESALTEKFGERVDLDEISLGVARYSDPEMQEAMVTYISKRLEKWKPDLVVPIGSPAGVFVAENRGRLFPDIPIIYTGMDGRRLPPEALQNNATFSGEEFNLPGFVEDILQIAPATTNIAVVLGSSPVEKYWATAFRREFDAFTNRVSFTWLNDLSFDHMLVKLSTLPPRSFIFLVLLHQDADGVTLNADDALRRIHAVANAPVNSIFQHQLGLGIVGGRLYQAEVEGRESAAMAVRILKGEAASSIPPKIVGPLPPQYDWRELQRWQINLANLPTGSTILFRQPGVWELYGKWIIGTILFCLLQAALILALLISRFKRLRGEEKVRQLSHAVEQSPVLVMVTDRQGQIIYVNQKFSEVTGYSSAEVLGKNPRILKSGETPPAIYRELWKCITRGDVWQGEFRNRKKNGEVYSERAIISPLHDAAGNITRFVSVKEDITERKETEFRLNKLSRRLIHAHETERARLGRELHDDVTQRLARLSIDVGRAEQGRDEISTTETLRSVREGLVRLSEDVHALSYRLHPAVLEDLGLVMALTAECERVSRQGPMVAQVTFCEMPEVIPTETALCVFRVTQEALRNAARHAQARKADVNVWALNGELQLAVVDNGIGFDAASQRSHPSLGLASMRERVLLLGGEIEIESAPGRGTTILASVPLKERIV